MTTIADPLPLAPPSQPPAQPPAAAGRSADPVWELATLFPNQGHWTEQEYLDLPNNRRVEFFRGHIQVLPVPTDLHQAIVGFLYVALLTFTKPAKLGTVRFSGLKVKVSDEQFREPDVVFIRAANAARRGQQFWLWADLVMEVVSDGFRYHDLQTKRREYALAGVPEYWIVDPLQQELSVLTLVGTGYEPAGVYRRGDRAASVILPGFGVDVTDVFDAD